MLPKSENAPAKLWERSRSPKTRQRSRGNAPEARKCAKMAVRTRAEGGNLNKMQNWCKFIGGCNERNIISELSADEAWKEDLDMALANYRNVSAEERSWAYHLSLDRAEADYRNGFRLAEEMGAQQANVATAQKLKQLGVSADIISQATGLSQQDILSLQ